LAAQAPKVCHWTFLQRDWRESSAALLDAAPCTIFIDPPYQAKGVYYAGSAWNATDYRALAQRCLVLKDAGHQVIVCERQGADWLPFTPLHTYHGSLADGVEVVWQ
jgi:16S rRNA G966 N2-methylase RsmD